MELIKRILAQFLRLGQTCNQRNCLSKQSGQVSDDEILEVLFTAKDIADEAGISEEMVEIDISDEFLKSVEEALGRSLV